MNKITLKNKIKILLISPDFDYSNGVTRHLRTLLKLLADCVEYEVHFLTNRGNAISELREIKNVNYSVFPFSNFRVNLFNHLKFYKYLENYCKKNYIDIIHTHHRYPEFISTLVAKKNKIKTVTTAHSFVRGLGSLSFKSDLVIAVSESVKNHIIRNFNVSPSRIVKIYNCINKSDYHIEDLNSNKFRKELNISENDFVIFYNGRINKIKGVDLLVNAFKLLEKYKNLKLLLVGSAEDNQIITDLPQNVYYFISDKNISKYYLISNVVILPSRIDPYPYVMLEASLFNKPFIGSRVDGIAEFIEDNIDGILFNPDDAEDLSQKISYAYKNIGKLNEMARNLKLKVELNCDCENYLNKIKSLYTHLVSS